MHSFIHFNTRFSFRESHGAAALRGMETPQQFSAASQFCWLHTKTGPNKSYDVDEITPPGLWSISGQFSRGFSQEHYLVNISWAFWPPDRSIAVVIFVFAEVARHSGFYEFYRCALGR